MAVLALHTQQGDFGEAVKIFFSALSSRGYCWSFLRKCFNSFLQTKQIDVSPLIPVVITYSPSTCKLVRVIKSNFQRFTQDTHMLQDYKVIAAFRRNKNLGDLLVKAKISPLSEPKRRDQGQFFQHHKWVRSYSNGNVFLSLCKGTPKSKNCVYLITCRNCGIQYVGETGNTLLVRFTQHRYNILHKKNTHTYLVNHFVAHGWESVGATAVQAYPRWTTEQRRRAEKIWIAKLDTTYPKGLNEEGFK